MPYHLTAFPMRRPDSQPENSPTRRLRPLTMVGVAAFGFTVQWLARARLASAGPRTHEIYSFAVFWGIVIMSCAAACALVLAARRRWRGALATIVAFLFSILFGAALFFCGLYWRWILGSLRGSG